MSPSDDLEEKLSVARQRSAYFSNGNESLPPILKDYLARFGDEPEDESRPVLIVQPFAGYADRLQGILTMFAVSVICRRRFAIRWVPDPGIDSVLAPNHLDWTKLPPNPPPIKPLWDSRLGKEIAVIMRQGNFAAWMDKNFLDGENIVTIGCNHNFLADLLADEPVAEEFGSLNRHALFKTLFRVLFKLNTGGAIAEMVAPLIRRIAPRPSIGVHIRVGGDGRWADPQFEDRDSVRRFEKRVSLIVEKEKLLDPIVYLASDSIDIKKAAREGDFLNGFEVVQQDIEPFHIDRVKDNQPAQQILTETVIDHVMLSTCDHVIRGKGGFATTACQLGANRLYSA